MLEKNGMRRRPPHIRAAATVAFVVVVRQVAKVRKEGREESSIVNGAEKSPLKVAISETFG